MKEEYSINSSRYQEQNIYAVVRVLKIAVPVYLLFAILFVVGNDKDGTVFLYFSLIFFTIVIIPIFIGLMIHLPVNNTHILLTATSIKRSGKGLTTCEMKFSEIKKVKVKREGMLVFREGLRSSFLYQFDKYAAISSKHLLFIPSNIDEYQRLKTFLGDKTSE